MSLKTYLRAQSSLRPGLQNCLLPIGFLTKPCIHLAFLLCVPHAPSICPLDLTTLEVSDEEYRTYSLITNCNYVCNLIRGSSLYGTLQHSVTKGKRKMHNGEFHRRQYIISAVIKSQPNGGGLVHVLQISKTMRRFRKTRS